MSINAKLEFEVSRRSNVDRRDVRLKILKTIELRQTAILVLIT